MTQETETLDNNLRVLQQLLRAQVQGRPRVKSLARNRRNKLILVLPVLLPIRATRSTVRGIMIYSLIDAIYWLALSGWFGAVLVSALVWPVIHKTIVDADPSLPLVRHTNLDKQHGTLLAGNVVSAVLKLMFRLELISAICLFPLLIVKWILIDRSAAAIVIPIMVTCLYLLALAFLLYGTFVVYPKVIEHRQKYLDNADNPDIANAELDLFDRYSGELISVVRNLLFSVLGIVLFSPFMLKAIQIFSAG